MRVLKAAALLACAVACSKDVQQRWYCFLDHNISQSSISPGPARRSLPLYSSVFQYANSTNIKINSQSIGSAEVSDSSPRRHWTSRFGQSDVR